MWIIYYKDDSWQCGWSVESEQEALQYCKKHPDYRCIWVNPCSCY